MILFIGWWQETGLAFQSTSAAPLSKLFSRPIASPHRARLGYLMHHSGGLPNGGPRRYVQYTSGPMDHYTPDSSSALDRMRRMWGHQRLFNPAAKSGSTLTAESLIMAHLQMHCLRKGMEPADFRAAERSRHRFSISMKRYSPTTLSGFGLRHSAFKRCGARRKGLMSLMITSSKRLRCTKLPTGRNW